MLLCQLYEIVKEEMEQNNGHKLVCIAYQAGPVFKKQEGKRVSEEVSHVGNHPIEFYLIGKGGI